MASLLDRHLHSTVGQSIAYYDHQGLYLGGATFRTSHIISPVYVCMSGQRIDDPRLYRTICRVSVGDDDMRAEPVYVRQCTVGRAPQVVLDGCYPFLKKFDEREPPFYEKHPVAAAFFVLAAVGTLMTILASCVKPLWSPVDLDPLFQRVFRWLRSFRRPPRREQENLPLFLVNPPAIQCVLLCS
jgi:hypothetical protein